MLQKILRICELAHIGAAKKYASPCRQAHRDIGNANARMDGGNRRRGRDWPILVGRRDVQLGARGRLGNELGRDIAACRVTRTGSLRWGHRSRKCVTWALALIE